MVHIFNSAQVYLNEVGLKLFEQDQVSTIAQHSIGIGSNMSLHNPCMNKISQHALLFPLTVASQITRAWVIT